MERKFRLKSMPHAQCHVVFSVNEYDVVDEVKLVSYATHVASIQFDTTSEKWERVLFSKWGNTTAKHINKFFEEFTGLACIYKSLKVGEYVVLSQQQQRCFYAACGAYEIWG